MAFSFGASAPAGGSAPLELGPELPDVFAEEVGFKGVSSDSNIRLLPTPWPEDALPAPTSSLLAVAPTKGVVVGAGPDTLNIATTSAVRAAISAPTGEDKVKTKPFQPQATIPLPARPTHITFASGDSALVLATENGAQLSVFQTESLLQGNAQPALSIPTNGTTFRFLAPNPAPAEDAHSSLVALVTTGGDLLIANIKAGSLVSGASGQVLKSGVSTVCWSNKGKQLVAGLADGTAFQLTPEGAQKDAIPRPPDLEDNCHVSSIAWLENDIFLMVYTSNAAEDDMGQTPSSSYYIITRRKQAPFLIQKLPELCMPFGVKRTPAYQFIARLRDYKPHLKDALIVSSTASTDVCMITRADQPLASDDAAKATTGLFVTTEVNDDTKRASLPLKDSTDETSVIGLGTDLSSTENVIAPIAGEDIAESSTPVPNLLLLNNEGCLSSWWFIYSDAVRQKIPYSGMASQTQQQQSVQPVQPAQPEPPKQPAFGQSSFGSPSTLGSSAFGKPAGAPGFGSPSPLGARQQPAFGTSSFGAPSFGTPSQAGTSFGTPNALGQPAFGKSGFGAMGGGASTFGQPSTPAKPLPFGASASGAGSGFGSFAGASTGGFGGLAASKPAGGSPFASMGGGGENPFGKPSVPSPFGSQAKTETAFPQTESKGAFGQGSSPFVLGSMFKGDGSAVTDAPRPEKADSFFTSGQSMDDMVSSSNKTSPPTDSMDDMDDEPAPAQKPEPKEAPSLFGQPSEIGTTAPESKQTSSLFGAPSKIGTTAPKPNQTSSLFGAPSKIGAAAPEPKQTSSLFGAPTSSPSSVFGSNSQIPNPFGQPQTSKSPFSMFGNGTPAKQVTSPLSPPSEKTAIATPPSTKTPSEDVHRTPVASIQTPLPPDSTSKTSYGPGDTSASSNVSKSSFEEAPLPPDFTMKPKTAPADIGGDAPLPPDFTAKPKKIEKEAEDAPLPPDFTIKKPAAPEEVSAPVPEDSDFDESEREESEEDEEDEEEEEDEEDEEGESEEDEESDFADSGEDVSRDISQPESPEASFGDTPESSFKFGSSTTSNVFSQAAKPPQQRTLFGEIGKPVFPAFQNREPPRSPSPVRGSPQKTRFKHPGQKPIGKHQAPGSTLAARKASLTETARRESLLRPQPSPKESRRAQAKQMEEEAQSLSDDDEDERLRADLARPLEPVPTLDPFLPHQNYAGETTKPGIPGQIERLYRDINSMVDTLGINARSMAAFLLYQRQSQNADWVGMLKEDHPANILDEKLLLCDIEKLDEGVVMLAGSLEQQRVQGVEEKLESCRELLSKDILTLRGQCASIRKTLDAHTDAAAIVSAPLSAEQANLQQDLRTASTDIQAKLAELESAVSLLRAKIADAPRPDGSRQATRRPTVEAVTSTIATMMNMAESKRSDIDVLEAQIKKLGIDTSAPAASREGSPAYHTPDSAARGNFRSSITGSRLRSVEGASELVSKEESAQWKTKLQRRQHIVGSLKRAIGEKKTKVRGVDDL
ncbi:hypothetical protein BO70DRAFT_432056 [Aspergillus heteromorphus CBS 117.55]|uniref:Nucleoporin Nup159/Nup146 N-terminal domain-containing protein n=1 Tax=Aspergillus heteromorphus CBS 117.55 TaxID=1448321 RepID=A0A317VD81_9EURO|nr:uncharacterized protein BO70DRAFT_432056 [Aspergillus heteromorphus CBS 117.55]PWY70968.1 hypothetical protein BO70DRAFT_432056 [Aspergillus heteromorphus CBS 117.55]